jgi:hypothetical protein
MHLHGDLITVVGAEDAPQVFHHPGLSFTASQFKVNSVLSMADLYPSGLT